MADFETKPRRCRDFLIFADASFGKNAIAKAGFIVLQK